jgi:virginiamycin B lyase
MRRLHLALAALVGLLAFPAAATAAGIREGPPVVGQVSEYELGAGTQATSLVAGPDGNLWFAGIRSVSGGTTDVVGKVTPQGQVTEYPLETHAAIVGLGEITVGPDGNLWFVVGGREKLGRITPTGDVALFDLPRGVSAGSLTAGPDGALWFTEVGTARLGRIATSGEVSELPLANSGGAEILSGPDGGLWIAHLVAARIARVGTDGSETDFPLPVNRSFSGKMVVGPDGALWLGEEWQGALVRMTLSGEVSELAVPGGKRTGALTSGPFDDLWYSIDGGRIGWVIPGVATGTVACINRCDAPIAALTEGPEGKLWFAAGPPGQSLYSTPGTVGTYAPPPLEVRVLGDASVRERTVYVPLSCPWTPAGRSCQGRLRLAGGGQVLRKRLSLRLGARRRVAVRLNKPLTTRLAQRGRVALKATTTVSGGRRDTSRIVLRRR